MGCITATLSPELGKFTTELAIAEADHVSFLLLIQSNSLVYVQSCICNCHGRQQIYIHRVSF